jgi:hypothetical protein
LPCELVGCLGESVSRRIDVKAIVNLLLANICLIPAALHEGIKDVPVLIDGTLEIVACAADPHKHFVQVPCFPRSRTSASLLIGIWLPELHTPLTDPFIGRDDATGKE